MFFSKRKNFLIMPSFQLKVIGFLVLIALLNGIYCIYLNGFVFQSFREKLSEVSGTGSLLMSYTHTLEDSLFVIYSTVTVTFVVIFSVVGLYITHKIAGPLKRIESHVNERLEGKHNNDLALRKGDLFIELAELINKILPGKTKQPLDQKD